MFSSSQRLGKLNLERKKPRPLLVTVANEHQARLILAKSQEHREDLIKQNIYFLFTRRQLLDQGVPREKLRIRNLELFNNGRKIHLESEKIESSRLGFPNIL